MIESIRNHAEKYQARKAQVLIRVRRFETKSKIFKLNGFGLSTVQKSLSKQSSLAWTLF